MADTQTPADLQAALTRAMADPRVPAAAKAWTDFHATHGVWNPGHGTGGPQTDFYNAIQPYLPQGYYATLGADGQPVLQKQGMPSWVFPLSLAAIGLTLGAATGAFAAPAAAADLGTSAIGGTAAGVGTTAADTAAAGAAAAAGKVAGAAGPAAGSAVTTGVKEAADSGLSSIEKAILALSGTVPALMSGQTNPDQAALMQKQRDILGIQESRLRQQDPLYQAVQRLSMSILPTYAQSGPRIGPELPGGTG